MLILNLGCGSKTSDHPNVVNIDWSIMLRVRCNPWLRPFARILINGDRFARYNKLSSNLIVHDITKRLPFTDNSVDAVYHSHVLEHFDRNKAHEFLKEQLRVLRSGGIVRVVVPDFERSCRNYLDHILLCERNPAAIDEHDGFVTPLLEMSVQREAFGSSQQKPLRRTVENLLLGDARQRGQTHQWMYDRFNLLSLLRSVGFNNLRYEKYDRSMIHDWHHYGLDLDQSGKEYKPGSLYVEATA